MLCTRCYVPGVMYRGYVPGLCTRVMYQRLHLAVKSVVWKIPEEAGIEAAAASQVHPKLKEQGALTIIFVHLSK